MQSITPKGLDSTQRERWKKAVKEVFDGRACADLFMYSIPYIPNKTIEKLSDLYKSITGHVIPKKTRKKMNLILAWIYQTEIGSMDRIAKEQDYWRESTDFLKDSMKMDEYFAKPPHGRYSENCEMLARAFDCYIADKLKKEGQINQYLTAYSEQFAMEENDGTIVYAIPRGEERTEINQNMDLMIQELKSLGLLHEKESAQKDTVFQDKKISIADVKYIAVKHHEKISKYNRDNRISYEKQKKERITAEGERYLLR